MNGWMMKFIYAEFDEIDGSTTTSFGNAILTKDINKIGPRPINQRSDCIGEWLVEQSIC